MATQRARIQQRHGTYQNFVEYTNDLLPEELVIIDSGHPDTTSGAAVYYKPGGADPVQLENAEDVDKKINDSFDELSSDIENLEKAIEDVNGSLENYVPKTRKITDDLDLADDITTAQLINALGLNNGSLDIITDVTPVGKAAPYNVGDTFLYNDAFYRFVRNNFIQGIGSIAIYSRIGGGVYSSTYKPPSAQQYIEATRYREGDLYFVIKATATNIAHVEKLYYCYEVSFQPNDVQYTWNELPLNIYSKSEIDDMIGDIESLLAEV